MLAGPQISITASARKDVKKKRDLEDTAGDSMTRSAK